MKNPITVAIIEVKPHPNESATNFDIRIEKSEAQRLLAQFGYALPFDIMCKEYGDDSEWVGLSPEDLDEKGLLNEEYQTFELWFPKN
ncbi:MAG: hypothetical protein V4592_17870 [Bacteroidota bacterium]